MPQRKERKRTRIVTQDDISRAEKLDFSFYDGTRDEGYGGYFYDGRWKNVALQARKRYGLNSESRVLVDRCHKGFLVFDLKELIPGIIVYGLHPKPYAINHAMDGYDNLEEKAKNEIVPFLIEGDSSNMPFKNGFFDTVLSIESACAYPENQCIQVVKEIVRVSKNDGKKCYIQNDSYINEHEKNRLNEWTLLCKTFKSTKEWEELYKRIGYKGDFGFTIIQ